MKWAKFAVPKWWIPMYTWNCEGSSSVSERINNKGLIYDCKASVALLPH